MKKDKSENTQVKVKKQYNVVKRMILYNIILIVAVIFLGSLIVFGVKYDSTELAVRFFSDRSSRMPPRNIGRSTPTRVTPKFPPCFPHIRL